MGCSYCKSQRRVSHSLHDDTITALLEETQSSPLSLQTKTEELKTSENDINHPPPKLLPDIRSLQSIIFQTLHSNEEYYNLYPKYSKLSALLNSSTINEEKWDISHKLLNISLNIALYTNGANVAYLTNLYNLLDHSIRINIKMILLPDLVQLIISFISGITFSDDIKHEQHRKQLEFGYNDSMVTFKYMTDDFLNIRSKQKIVGPKIIINCYVLNKGKKYKNP